jgi:hypothetical protein
MGWDYLWILWHLRYFLIFLYFIAGVLEELPKAVPVDHGCNLIAAALHTSPCTVMVHPRQVRCGFGTKSAEADLVSEFGPSDLVDFILASSGICCA